MTFWSFQTLFVWGPNKPCLPGHLEVPSYLLYFWFDESEIPLQRVSNIFAKPESFRRLAWVSGIFRNYLDNQEKIQIIWRVIRCWESVSKKVNFLGFHQVLGKKIGRKYPLNSIWHPPSDFGSLVCLYWSVEALAFLETSSASYVFPTGELLKRKGVFEFVFNQFH